MDMSTRSTRSMGKPFPSNPAPLGPCTRSVRRNTFFNRKLSYGFWDPYGPRSGHQTALQTALPSARILGSPRPKKGKNRGHSQIQFPTKTRFSMLASSSLLYILHIIIIIIIIIPIIIIYITYDHLSCNWHRNKDRVRNNRPAPAPLHNLAGRWVLSPHGLTWLNKS